MVLQRPAKAFIGNGAWVQVPPSMIFISYLGKFSNKVLDDSAKIINQKLPSYHFPFFSKYIKGHIQQIIFLKDNRSPGPPGSKYVKKLSSSSLENMNESFLRITMHRVWLSYFFYIFLLIGVREPVDGWSIT